MEFRLAGIASDLAIHSGECIERAGMITQPIAALPNQLGAASRIQFRRSGFSCSQRLLPLPGTTKGEGFDHCHGVRRQSRGSGLCRQFLELTRSVVVLVQYGERDVGGSVRRFNGKRLAIGGLGAGEVPGSSPMIAQFNKNFRIPRSPACGLFLRLQGQVWTSDPVGQQSLFHARSGITRKRDGSLAQHGERFVAPFRGDERRGEVQPRWRRARVERDRTFKRRNGSFMIPQPGQGIAEIVPCRGIPRKLCDDARIGLYRLGVSTQLLGRITAQLRQRRTRLQVFGQSIRDG